MLWHQIGAIFACMCVISATASDQVRRTVRSAAPKSSLGVCYEPFHSKLYPINGGDSSKIPQILDADLPELAKTFGYIRTYHAQYYGFPIVKAAKKYGLKVYLGLQPYDNQEWYAAEIQAAVTGAKENPGTIEAVLFGNENLKGAGGKYTADMILQQVTRIKSELSKGGSPNIPVGTAQRITEWLDSNNRAEMDKLANGVDIIGVHIYPFFSPNWDPARADAQLTAQWNALQQRYPQHVNKMRILETGWPNKGGAPSGQPKNVASDANQKTYFNAYKSWNCGKCTGPRFWFMAFDRRADDPVMNGKPEFERYFGLYTTENGRKPALN